MLHNRVDVQMELGACEAIRATNEARLDLELSKAGLDPAGLQERLEAVITGLPRGLPLAGQMARAEPKTGSTDATQSLSLGLSRSALLLGSTAGTLEAAGPMKFFDSNKGYGFFTADQGGGDVMVHVTTLEAAGHRTVYEGTRIHALVQKTAKGLQAVQILSIDDSTAVHPSLVPARTKEKVMAESEWVRAIVKFYDRLKGYGFVHEGPDAPDCFVHADTLRRWGMAPLRPGQAVEVRWGKSSKGQMVAEIRHPDSLSGLPQVH
jgi:cold shock protein